MTPETSSRLAVVTDENSAAFADMLDMSIVCNIFDAVPDRIKIMNTSGGILYMNQNGRPDPDGGAGPAGGRRWETLWPEESRALVRASVQLAASGQNAQFEAFAPTGDGVPKWWEVNVTGLHKHGAVRFLVAVSRDISDRVLRDRAQREHAEHLQELLDARDVLLAEREAACRESDHRFRNALATVASTLSFEMRKAPEAARDAIAQARRRVDIIDRIHRALCRTKAARTLRLDTFLTDVVGDIRELLGARTQISASIDPIALARASASEVATIVGELVLNSAQHGRAAEGLNIAVRIRGSADAIRSIEVADDGAGLPADFAIGNSDGLGLRLVLLHAAAENYHLTFGRSDLGGAFFRLQATHL